MPKLSNCIHYLLWQDVHYNDTKLKNLMLSWKNFFRVVEIYNIHIYIWLSNHETLQGLPIYVVL